VVRLAVTYGFHVLISFHQYMWARMSVGTAALGWTFDKMGLDFTTFHDADAARALEISMTISAAGTMRAGNRPGARLKTT
jgi:hypothetical protein